MDVNAIIEEQLVNANLELGKYLKADVVLLRTPMVPPIDDEVRHCIESMTSDESRRQSAKLCVVLETNGGYIEVVERIYNVFRFHYNEVTFVIPNHAYSAGTVLVLSGDVIYMDYYSVLGPIDPQITSEDNKTLVPGIGYLIKFNELLEKINADPQGERTRGEWRCYSANSTRQSCSTSSRPMNDPSSF